VKALVVRGEDECELVLSLLRMHAEVKEGEPDAVLAEKIISDAAKRGSGEEVVTKSLGSVAQDIRHQNGLD